MNRACENSNTTVRTSRHKSIECSETKKTVLHISHTDIRTDSRILKELEAHQKSGAYKVKAIGVIASEGNPSTKLDPDIELESIQLASNRTKWNPRALRHLFTMLELTFRVIRKAVKASPDAIHCHDTLVLPIGFIVKLLTGAKLVYDAHELESNKNGQTKTLSKATLFIEKLCWRSVDLLVSVSPSILRWYDDNLGKKDNVLVLNSPVVEDAESTENETVSNRYFHERFDIPEDNLVFIYLGNLSRGRGIELVLDAFSKPAIKSHVVFMGYGDLADTIEAKSATNNNIHLHPAVKHDMVVKLAQTADVGLCFVEEVSLSDYYCLPNKLFEYAFSGLPVLASSFPDLKDYVDNYGLGLCSDVNPDAMYERIREFEDNPPKKVKTDLEELSWGAQASRLVKAYDGVFA